MRSQLVPAFKMKEGREVGVGVKVEAEATAAAEAGVEEDIPHRTRSRIRSRSSALNLQLKWRQRQSPQVTPPQKRRGEEEVTGQSTEIAEPTAAAAIPAMRRTGETEGEKEILLPGLLLHLQSVSPKLKHPHQ